MATNTKESLANAFRKMLSVKPIDKITVKDLVEECGVNRQTFYYHFNDIYDLMEWVFEVDAEQVLPTEIDIAVAANWRKCVLSYFEYLYKNKDMVINIYNSQSRSYMLRFYIDKLRTCVHGFAVIVSAGKTIDWADLEFVVDFYVYGIVGIISMWLDNNVDYYDETEVERFMTMLDNSVEQMLEKYTKK